MSKSSGAGETRPTHPDASPEHTPEEFLRLLDQCRDALYRFARGATWDRSRVEDVLQEAILEGYKSFHRFELGTNFRAWMMLILSRTIYPKNRQYRKQLDRETQLDARDLDASTAARESLTDPDGATPLDDIEGFLDQTSDEVRRAIEDLPPAQRTVFLLRAAEGLSYNEVAEALEIPIGTVMSHLARARVKLRERLYGHARDIGLAGQRMASAPEVSPPEVSPQEASPKVNSRG